MTKVLVAYASKHHSTAEIAQAIGKTLQAFPALEVEVRSVELVEDITPYDGVILGSAVYAAQWQLSAVNFLKKYEQELAKRPVWLFSSGPAGEPDTKPPMKAWTFPEALTAVASRIHPRDIAVFQGKIDPANLNFFEQSVTKIVKVPTGDFRDWDIIRGWADGIAKALTTLEPQPM